MIWQSFEEAIVCKEDNFKPHEFFMDNDLANQSYLLHTHSNNSPLEMWFSRNAFQESILRVFVGDWGEEGVGKRKDIMFGF